MFATAARILLSTVFLLLAVILSPFIFQPPAPETAPVWSLRVLQTPDAVAVGDTVSVEIVLLRNGLPAQVAHAQPQLHVIDDEGMLQDALNPVLVVSQPVQGESDVRAQRWVATYTAVRPGPARFHAVVEGEPSAHEPLQKVIRAEGFSEPIQVEAPQITSNEALSLTPLYFGGIVALCLLSLYFYRRQLTHTA